MLNQKMKLYMMQTCFNKNETLADWLDFDINPSYLNELKRKEVIVDEQKEDEKIKENEKEKSLDTSSEHNQNDEELNDMNNLNNSQVIEKNKDDRMEVEKEGGLDTFLVQKK